MPDEVRSLLEAYPPEVRELALEARELVLRLVPEAEERVLRPWKSHVKVASSDDLRRRAVGALIRAASRQAH